MPDIQEKIRSQNKNSCFDVGGNNMLDKYNTLNPFIFYQKLTTNYHIIPLILVIDKIY